MKKLLLVTVIALFTLISNAQNVSKFVGVPFGINSSKFKSQLELKGFKHSKDRCTFTGKFLDEKVLGIIKSTPITNKVYQSMIVFGFEANVSNYNKLINIYESKYGRSAAERITNSAEEVSFYVTTYKVNSLKISVVWDLDGDLISILYTDCNLEEENEREQTTLNNRQI